MNGTAFIRLAERYAASQDEAERRTAISRGYYAAFHAARDFFAFLGFRVPRADAAHVYLSRRLSAVASVPNLSASGNDLNSLRGYRNEADYDMHKPVSIAKSQLAVALANRVLSQLGETRAADAQARLAEEISAYETSVLRESTR